MYSNTYNSIIIPIFVLIQFCNINLIFTSHHPFIFFCMNTILLIFSKMIIDTELIHMLVHFIIVDQFYVNVNVELFLHVFLHLYDGENQVC